LDYDAWFTGSGGISLDNRTNIFKGGVALNSGGDAAGLRGSSGTV
jgi:hypothetical protein